MQGSARTMTASSGEEFAREAPPLLAVDGVTLQYKTDEHLVTATWRVGFDVFAGERFVLLGPSGCGKSTLLEGDRRLHAAGRGQHPARRLADRCGPAPDRMMVFQEFDQLLPWKTVLGNVMFPLLVNRRMSRATPRSMRATCSPRCNLTRFESVLSAHAVRRHEAAHRDRARARDGAEGPADGRAVRRARRADAPQDAGGIGRLVGARSASP